MLRFSWNRWWVFILTLCLFTTGFALLGSSAPSVAAAEAYRVPSADQPSPGPGVGDPDLPLGPGDGKTSGLVVRSTSRRVVVQQEVRPAGDVTTSDSVLVERLRLLLLSLRSLYLGF